MIKFQLLNANIFFSVLSAIFLWGGLCFAQADKNESGSNYDSLLAKKLGADDYGMKKYVMAFLKSGKTKMEDKDESNRLQMEHLKNIQRLAD